MEAAPYLMVGFVVAGVLHQYLPARFVQKHLGGDSWFNIFKASVIGTPVPLCSCGVVPVGLGLHRDGASKATSISFLIATPENGVESISLTYSFFGLPFTVARVVFAILVANLTAIGVALFAGKVSEEVAAPEAESGCCGSSSCCSEDPPAEVSCCGSQAASVEKRDGLRFVVDDFVPSIAKWVVLGFLISAGIATVLPSDLLSKVDPLWAVPLAGLVGIPMYVCASASTPIAFSLFMNGLSPGACLVFLLTGPATNSANFPLYLKTFGSRATAIYYGGIYFVSVALGLALDYLFEAPKVLSLPEGGHHNFDPGFFHYGGAVVLAVMLAYGIWKSRTTENEGCCG